MKTIYLNVEFKDPETELKAQLQKSGARNVEVRRNYNGELEVRYTIKVANPQKDIEELQVQFVSKEYKEKKLSHLLPVALDLIRLQGAFSRAYADGETTVLHLTYHPEDLFSPYAQDVVFFQKGAKKSPLKIKVYPHKKGPQWKNLK